MDRVLRYGVSLEDGAFVARCVDVEVTSDGESEQEAAANLQEALERYFDEKVVLVPTGSRPVPRGVAANP